MARSTNWTKVILSILFLIVLCSCLKTRRQVRDEGPEEHEVPKPSSVQSGQDGHPTSGQYVIDEIKAEFTRLEGRVDDLERRQKGLSGKSNLSEDLKKLDAKVTQLEQSQIQIQETLNKLQETATLADPTELYKKAQQQYEDQDYEGTIETLTLYLKSPKAKKQDDALYLKGECYYKLKQYKKAIVEYSKFQEKYSKSSRAPEALYKIGLSFDALGMKDDSKGFYQELIEKYPKSSEAKKARKKVK